MLMNEATVATGATENQPGTAAELSFKDYQARRKTILNGEDAAPTAEQEGSGNEPEAEQAADGDGNDTQSGGELEPGEQDAEANKKKVFSAEDVNRIVESRLQRERRQSKKVDRTTGDEPEDKPQKADKEPSRAAKPDKQARAQWEAKEPDEEDFETVDEWYDKWIEWKNSEPAAKPTGEQQAQDTQGDAEPETDQQQQGQVVDGEFQLRVDDLVLTLQRDVSGGVIEKDIDQDFWSGLRENDIFMSYPILRFLNDHSADETASLLIQEFVRHPNKSRRIAKMESDYEAGKALKQLVAELKPKKARAKRQDDKPRDRNADASPVDLPPLGGSGNEPAKEITITDFKQYSKMRPAIVGR